MYYINYILSICVGKKRFTEIAHKTKKFAGRLPEAGLYLGRLVSHRIISSSFIVCTITLQNRIA